MSLGPTGGRYIHRGELSRSKDARPGLLLLEEGNHLLTGHTGDPVEEIVNGLAPLQVLDESLHRHPCITEGRRAAQDVKG